MHLQIPRTISIIALTEQLNILHIMQIMTSIRRTNEYISTGTRIHKQLHIRSFIHSFIYSHRHTHTRLHIRLLCCPNYIPIAHRQFSFCLMRYTHIDSIVRTQFVTYMKRHHHGFNITIELRSIAHLGSSRWLDAIFKYSFGIMNKCEYYIMRFNIG